MKISVIIPTYNSEKTIGKLIESLFKQSVTPYEIIIADGNSTDSTREICDSFGCPYLKFILNPNGHETGSNRNLGADYASGEYLIFLDSDCIADKDMIKAYSADISHNPEISCFAGNVFLANPGSVSTKMYLHERFFMDSHIKDDFVKDSFFWVMNFCIRKDDFIPFHDVSYIEDMIFINDIFRNGVKVKFSRKAIAYHKYADTEESFFMKRLNSFRGFLKNREYITRYAQNNIFSVILQLLELDPYKLEEMLLEQSLCIDKKRGVVFDGRARIDFRFPNLLLLSAAVSVLEYKGVKIGKSYNELVKYYGISESIKTDFVNTEIVKDKHVRFSIIIPTYNSQKTIGALIKSLLEQTILPYEIIVVDGNSTDSTREICGSFACPYLKVVKNPKGHETGTNRNIGFENATGDYLIFLDSDCIAEKNLIRSYLDIIISRSAQCIAGNVLIINPGNISSKAYLTEKYLLSQNLFEDKASGLTYVKSTFFWVMNFCIRKDRFLLFPDTSYSEDMVFIESLFKTGISVLFSRKAVAFHPYPESYLEYFKKRLNTAKGFIEQRDRITNIDPKSYFSIILELLELTLEGLFDLLYGQKICFDDIRGYVLDGHATKRYAFQNTLLLSAIVAVIEHKGGKIGMGYEELIDGYGS